ncbi:MAG: cell division protein FtsB [Gammaproteobacteria bacterium]|nr:MAG: cell division protein FtsB [Gammaproteobacteria bacterium]
MPWLLRLLTILLLVMFFVLQYRQWVGQGSLAEVASLERRIQRQQARIAEMEERNAMLRAEVESLKKGLDVVEARAREDLGMIREGETFYQVIPKDASK